MKKPLIYICILALIFSFTRIQNTADVPLCGVKSDVRYYFFEEGLYEFSVAEANTGTSKFSVCIEGTEASGRCKEDNFNTAWRVYVDKGLSIAVWKSLRRKVKGEDGKFHSAYGAPEETPILKEGEAKNWKNWKGDVLKWQESDSTGKVIFKINIKVKKIK
jgi:hypothetical protein